ncbi:hypothetical protein DUI87_09131 [Hirundo rustica rustica]|uniref:Uncharacterized protein n=1 Tax=Hirundo rustica rustica TaxID=333673 RepID=A0A3M0KRQ5_HIRRU|nr:hypothetical protein DUI87_09131 [Hirundo rustica rustica]
MENPWWSKVEEGDSNALCSALLSPLSLSGLRFGPAADFPQLGLNKHLLTCKAESQTFRTAAAVTTLFGPAAAEKPNQQDQNMETSALSTPIHLPTVTRQKPTDVANTKHSKIISQDPKLTTMAFDAEFKRNIVKEEPARRGAMLDPVLTNKGLLGNVKHKGSSGCSDHEMVEFKILRAARRVNSKLTSLELRQEDLHLFVDLIGRVPQDKAPEGRGTQERWLIVKDHS